MWINNGIPCMSIMESRRTVSGSDCFINSTAPNKKWFTSKMNGKIIKVKQCSKVWILFALTLGKRLVTVTLMQEWHRITEEVYRDDKLTGISENYKYPTQFFFELQPPAEHKTRNVLYIVRCNEKSQGAGKMQLKVQFPVKNKASVWGLSKRNQVTKLERSTNVPKSNQGLIQIQIERIMNTPRSRIVHINYQVVDFNVLSTRSENLKSEHKAGEFKV